VRSVIYYTKGTVEERLLAVRREQGDFDHQEDTDALTVMSRGANSGGPGAPPGPLGLAVA
jgi:hypothetical protein